MHALEQKIEKLENIENRLPEEQRSLDHLSELRAIERNKIARRSHTKTWWARHKGVKLQRQ